MKNTLLPLFFASMTITSAASAEGLNQLTYGAGYTTLSDSGVSLDLVSAGAAGEYQAGNFLFNGGLSIDRLSGGGNSADITQISARVTYLISPNTAFYGGLDYADIEGVSDATVYGLGAEYNANGFGVGINYSDPDVNGAEATTAIYAGYAVSDDLELFAAYSSTDGEGVPTIGLEFENETYDVAAVYSSNDGIYIFSATGFYDFGNQFRVSGGYTELNGEVDLMSVGGGYEVSNDLWIDASYGQASGGGESIDVIGLSIVYDFGDETLLIDRAQNAQGKAFGILSGTILNNL